MDDGYPRIMEDSRFDIILTIPTVTKKERVGNGMEYTASISVAIPSDVSPFRVRSRVQFLAFS